ncbi:MAG: sugar phosphorylase [Gammaproteobacteria bacterium]|nr:sugar phosphorylase [Gammaproteobacteria bacterium]
MQTVIAERIRQRLAFLYGETEAVQVLPDFLRLLADYRQRIPASPMEALQKWDESDVVLITYADSIEGCNEQPLRCLKAFADHWLQDSISTIHLLPFFPYTSDDGFSVVDYRSIREDLGSWNDVRAISEHFSLMYDFVLNHCSSHSAYFKGFCQGEGPYADFIACASPEDDLSQVVRPRSLPLLTEVQTKAAARHVWTTFSPDQVDLNYRNPRVLLEMLDILLGYLEHGARIIRLDAIAFLWKEPGTTSLHLPQTHEVVKLFRDVAEHLLPEAIMLTETNVPHRENISYFGHGDEAQMVYQFSLPPLLLHAIHSGNARHLLAWLQELAPAPQGCTFFNFTASHDGIGVRPLEGLLDDAELTALLADMQTRGGKISTRRNAAGQDVPYELNITYFDAFRAPGEHSDPWQLPRFLLSQTFAMSLQGIPGVYINSLLATPNDHAGVAASGHNRSINRHHWQWERLVALLDAPESTTAQTLKEYTRRLYLRRSQPAFHPDASQHIMDFGSDGLIGLVRKTADNAQTIVALYNFTSQAQHLPLAMFMPILGRQICEWFDLLHQCPPSLDIAGASESRLRIKPYGCYWLTCR